MPSKGQITEGKRQFPEDYALRSNESSDFKDKPIGARKSTFWTHRFPKIASELCQSFVFCPYIQGYSVPNQT